MIYCALHPRSWCGNMYWIEAAIRNKFDSFGKDSCLYYARLPSSLPPTSIFRPEFIQPSESSALLAKPESGSVASRHSYECSQKASLYSKPAKLPTRHCFTTQPLRVFHLFPTVARRPCLSYVQLALAQPKAPNYRCLANLYLETV